MLSKPLIMGFNPVSQKGVSMIDPVYEQNPKTVSLSGLEQFFSAEKSPSNVTEAEGWTLAEAAEEYNVTERTIRRWIKDGRLQAWKVDGHRGQEWRVHPTQSNDTRSDTAADNQSYLLLAGLLKDQILKLEAASYRAGYLENQVRTYEEQVKLLPDLQARVRKLDAQEQALRDAETELSRIKSTWWYRFWTWFTASNSK